MHHQPLHVDIRFKVGPNYFLVVKVRGSAIPKSSHVSAKLTNLVETSSLPNLRPNMANQLMGRTTYSSQLK